MIVNAALEASGAPIHELDRALGLDGGHCRVHILWHHISSAVNRIQRVPRPLMIGDVRAVDLCQLMIGPNRFFNFKLCWLIKSFQGNELHVLSIWGALEPMIAP